MSNTKKKKRRVLLISVAAMALAAAATTLIYFMFLKKDKDNIDYSEYATATLKEIVNASKIPEKEYDNLDLSNAVLNIPDIDKLYKLYIPNRDVFSPEDCDANCFELFDLVFDYVKEENPDFAYTDARDNPLADGETDRRTDIRGKFSTSAISYNPDNEKYYQCRFDASGRFIIYEIPTAGLAYEDEFEIIHLNRGEKAPDTKYLVDGKEYSPAQALEFAQKTMSEKVSKFIADIEVSPTEMIITKIPESDNYIYTVQFEYVYEGTPYFYLSVPNAIERDQFAQYGVIHMIIGSPDRVTEIYNMTDHREVKNDGAYEDRYISLADATDLLNEYLAPYFKQKISEVAIKYVTFDTPKFHSYEEFEEYVQSDPEEDYEKTYMRPCWCFIIDKENPISADYCLSAKAIFVDMQTGEVTTCIGVH